MCKYSTLLTVSFDESKNTDNNIATKGNIIQDSRAALDRQWSQEGRPQEGPPKSLLGHICLYAYMHKVNPNIFRYFLWFYSCITFISLFSHRSNFFLIFSLFFLPFYSLQKPVTLTQHCWFCFRLSARIPARLGNQIVSYAMHALT